MPYRAAVTVADLPAIPAGIASLRHASATSLRHALRRGTILPQQFLSDADLLAISGRLATTMTIGHLIGRWRILERARPYLQFNDDPAPPWTPEAIGRLFTPYDAIDYFRGIMPFDFDPMQFLRATVGRAFSLAVTASNVIRSKVAKVIEGRLETGKMISSAGREIDAILDEIGIEHPNGYGEMVFRTNAMESYREGGWEQFSSPSVSDYFPAWQYTGIDDGRERQGPEPEKPDHHRHFKGVWDRSISFFDVRGREIRDVANCRCDMIAMTRRELAAFVAAGGVLQTTIPFHAAPPAVERPRIAARTSG